MRNRDEGGDGLARDVDLADGILRSEEGGEMRDSGREANDGSR